MANLILLNANLPTVEHPSQIRRLIAIKNGRISAVTSNNDLRKLKNRETRVIDCQGKTVLPGFFDPHIHIQALAESLVTINLEPSQNIRSIVDIQSTILSFSQRLPAGTWIRCKGYNEFYLSEKKHPTRWDLDKAAPNHPVKLTHRTGHAHVLNSLALELVGISKQTPDPAGSLIDRDYKNGEPTGLLFEMGTYLSKRIPPLKRDELEIGIKMANDQLLSMGITSIQEVSSYNHFMQWENFVCWKKTGLLKPRINMMLSADGLNFFQQKDIFRQTIKNQVQINGIKLILDQTTGELYPPQNKINEAVLKIHQSGHQVAIHAIEEAAVESACSAVEYALNHLPKADHRHRIEHCSVCPPRLSERIASLGIFVVTQPGFIYYNGDRYLKTVPKWKWKHLYPIGSLLEKGIMVAGSSDCPVAPANPLVGIYSAISRMTETGKVLAAGEKILPLEALKLYTCNAARATFEENEKGSIFPGKLADLILINGDPTQLLPHELLKLEVEKTIINGEIVWEKKPGQT